MLEKIKNFLYKLMYGRNGFDQLSFFLLILAFVFFIPSTFIKSDIKYLFLILFWIVVIYSYYRAFSKKLFDRQKENNAFISKFNYLKTRISQRKTYKFYDCPKCKTHLRVPKGVGNVTITCKKCGHQFDKKA